MREGGEGQEHTATRLVIHACTKRREGDGSITAADGGRGADTRSKIEVFKADTAQLAFCIDGRKTHHKTPYLLWAVRNSQKCHRDVRVDAGRLDIRANGVAKDDYCRPKAVPRSAVPAGTQARHLLTYVRLFMGGRLRARRRKCWPEQTVGRGEEKPSLCRRASLQSSTEGPVAAH